MSETPSAKFALDDYSFTDYSFKQPQIEEFSTKVKFTPSGKFYKEKSVFELFLSTDILESDDDITEPFIRTKMKATFVFSDLEGGVPKFFYVNSIAILFPYVRAFVSTMTLQSNDGILMLPTLNLIDLGKELESNTEML